MNNKQILQSIKSLWWVPLSVFCLCTLSERVAVNNELLSRQEKVNTKAAQVNLLPKVGSTKLGEVVAVDVEIEEGIPFCSANHERNLIILFNKGRYVIAGTWNSMTNLLDVAGLEESILEGGKYVQNREQISLLSDGPLKTLKILSGIHLSKTRKTVSKLSFYSEILTKDICSKPEGRLAERLLSDYLN